MREIKKKQEIFIKKRILSLFSALIIFVIILLRKNIIKQIIKIEYTNILSAFNIFSSSIFPIRQNIESLK